jgi:teichuronic acid biosynthesis glycosyltransferase TuaC
MSSIAGERRLRVLVLSRSYPSDLLPMLGLWVQRPTELLAERCEVRVVSAVPWCPPLPAVGPLRQYVRFRRIPRREIRAGISIDRPRFLAGPGRSLYALEARAQEASIRRAVDRITSSFSFDLIHAHMIYPEGVVAHRLSRRHGVPFVVSEHAPWTDSWFRQATVRRQALDAAYAASSLLAVSTSVRQTIAAFGVDVGKVLVLPVGVDGERFRLGPAAGRHPDQVLYVGWLNYNKGIDVLLQAMALLRRRDVRVRLLLVGGAAYRNTRLQEEELRRLASSLGLDGSVTFLGGRPQDEVARLMAESALLVLPSRAESFGAVLVEALACGTPVVATRCGGPEDIVRDGLGLLVPTDDPLALADGIEEMLRRRTTYAPDDLRREALSRFSWDRVVDEIHSAYHSAVEADVRARAA